MDYSLPGFSVHGIFQVRILVWVAIPFSRDLPNPGIEPTSPSSATLAGGFFTSGATWETHEKWYAAAAAAKSLQLCPTLCDPIDGSPPGSPVPGILQARTLERVAISFFNA